MAQTATENLVKLVFRLAGFRVVKMPPALRYPAYRAYWLGTLASVSGFMMLTFGLGWLVFQLTGSPLQLGFVGLASASSAIGLNLFGGVYADKLDRRRLIIVTQSTTAGLIFILATMTLLEVIQPWHIFVFALVTGAVNAFNQPAQQALFPSLIDRKVMMSAVALNSAIWSGTRIFAPAVAGFVIAGFGTSASFYLAGAGFVTMAMVIFRLRVPPTERKSTGSPLQDMAEGLKFIQGNAVFSFLIGMTFFNSFFGMAYIMMMPVFAVEILDVGADGQGLLMSVGGTGALAVTMYLGTRSSPQHRGLLIIGGAVVFGLTVAAFALTARYVGSFPLAMGLIVVMGISSSTYMISIMSSLQLLVPDHMRGRVMGFYGMTWSIMPLGAAWVGAITKLSFIDVPSAIAAGGVIVSGFALGPALLNSKIRNVGALLSEAETAIASRPTQAWPRQTSPRQRTGATAGDD